jgi:hypothetical protein
MPWRQTVPVCKRLCRDRLAARMERHIDDGGNRKHAIFGKPRHEF